MEALTHVLQSLLQLLITIGDFVVSAIVAIEVWLREQLTALGLAPQLQTLVLVVIAILLVLGAFRLFGGLIRVAVIIVLLLIAIHALLPAIKP